MILYCHHPGCGLVYGQGWSFADYVLNRLECGIEFGAVRGKRTGLKRGLFSDLSCFSSSCKITRLRFVSSSLLPALLSSSLILRWWSASSLSKAVNFLSFFLISAAYPSLMATYCCSSSAVTDSSARWLIGALRKYPSPFIVFSISLSLSSVVFQYP